MKESFDKIVSNSNLPPGYEDKVKQDRQYAIDLLKDKPNGTKIPYTALWDNKTGQLIPRPKYSEIFPTEKINTIHSYIKIEDEIYQMAQGKKPNALAGKGSFGKTKFIDKEGIKSIVKIEKSIDPRMINEYNTLKDLGLSFGKSKRPNKEKYYTQMPYLGKPLIHFFDTNPILCPQKPKDSKIRANLAYFYLKDEHIECIYADKEGNIKELCLTSAHLGKDYQPLVKLLELITYPPKQNDEEPIAYPQRLNDEALKTTLFEAIGYHPEVIGAHRRLEIAIAICLEVAYLHEGRKSFSKVGYAHLDLKPENITIDSFNEIHLIDYGLAEANPFEPRLFGNKPSGTPSYLPFCEQGTILSRQEFDMLALKRTLFLPLSLYSARGYETNEDYEQTAYSVLTQTILNDFDLSPYVDTSSTEDEKKYFAHCEYDARTLAAILIIARFNINLDYKKVIKNKHLSLVITSLYAENKTCPHFKKKIENAVFSEQQKSGLLTCGVFSCGKQYHHSDCEEPKTKLTNCTVP